MGGGVGLGCHVAHRIVGDSSQVAMPECGIGLVPDVGGSSILARAPGRLGEYLGITGSRMNASDAIFSGFADGYLPESMWTKVIHNLEQSGDVAALTDQLITPGSSALQALQSEIDTYFDAETLAELSTKLAEATSDFAAKTLKAVRRASPLSVNATLQIIYQLRSEGPQMARALELEYRFTSRSSEHGDFLEGIRAAIIDKDRDPRWQYSDGNVPVEAVSKMLAPRPEGPLTF